MSRKMDLTDVTSNELIGFQICLKLLHFRDGCMTETEVAKVARWRHICHR